MPAGVQAARSVGMLDDRPSAYKTSVTKYKINPQKTALVTAPAPLLRWVMRKEDIAAINMSEVAQPELQQPEIII